MQKKTTVGKVVNVQDPAYAGRITVELAEVGGKEYPEWVEPIILSGWLWLPEPGDNVEVEIPSDTDDLVEFADEVKWRGIVYDQDSPVSGEFKENYPKRRGFKTKAGHVLIVDDKDKVISLSTPLNHILLLSEKDDKVSLRYKDTDVLTINASGIFLGTETATEPIVLGNLWKTMMDTILTALAAHVHPTGVGPSGPPDNAAVYTAQAALTAATISDFIFGQKTKP